MSMASCSGRFDASKSLGKRTPLGKTARAEVESLLSEDSNCGKTEILKVDEVRSLVFSDQPAAKIVAQLQDMFKLEGAKYGDLVSTQEESVQEDEDLCDFEILTTSDFLQSESSQN